MAYVSHHHYHHHISVMELGHLLTRSSLTYPEVSSKICHDSFCQLENSVSLPWVIYYEAFHLHVQFLLYSSNLSKICVIFNSFVIPQNMRNHSPSDTASTPDDLNDQQPFKSHKNACHLPKSEH